MLYLLSKNAIYRDSHMDTLMWLGELAPGEWVSAEKYQYLAEDFGFVIGGYIFAVVARFFILRTRSGKNLS